MERGKCQVCSKTSESRCSWCRLVFYCSKEHQKQHWDLHKATCNKKKYSMECNETVGHHLVATEDIKADWILLKDRPVLLCVKANSLEFTPNKICLGCYKEIKVDENEDESDSGSSSSESTSSSSAGGEKWRNVCLKCGLPCCSEECSSQYFHKAFECRLISEALPFNNQFKSDEQAVEVGLLEQASASSSSSLQQNAESKVSSTMTNVRETILRHLIYFRCILLKQVSPSQWDEMMSLQSDDENRRDLPQLERTTKMWLTLKRIFQHINHIYQVYKPDVHKILGILDINAFHFNISPDVEVSALFPTFSQISHSCIPNARFYLSPLTEKKGKYLFEIYVRTAVKIKKGERLLVSHVNLMWNTEKRRDHLKRERGGFICQCPRCLDPTELNTNFSTIICTQEGCKSASVPISKNPPLNTEFHWKCSKCSKVYPQWQVKNVDSRLGEMVARTKPSLSNYKQVLSKMHELVNPGYYLCFILNHSLVQMYGEQDADNDSEDEDTRMHNAKMLEEKMALCNLLVGTIKKLDPGLAKLNIYVSVIYYEMSSAILAMGGGEVDDDFKVLRHKPEILKLSKAYLIKSIEQFKYEMIDVPELKLKRLALKKMEYLDFILTKFKPTK